MKPSDTDSIFTPHNIEKRNLRKKRSNDEAAEILNDLLVTLKKTRKMTEMVFARERKKFEILKVEKLEYQQRIRLMRDPDSEFNHEWIEYLKNRKI